MCLQESSTLGLSQKSVMERCEKSGPEILASDSCDNDMSAELQTESLLMVSYIVEYCTF